MDFRIDEIDRFDFTTCPYSSTHRFRRTDKFDYHMQKCEHQANSFGQVALMHCLHNKSHVFTTQQALDYHMQRCPDHPQRIPDQRLHSCPFNPNHEAQDLLRHEAECPNKDNKWTPPPENIAEPSVQLAEAGSEQIVTVSFLAEVHKMALEYKNEPVPLRFLRVEHAMQANQNAWPGLVHLETQQSHAEYLVGYLQPVQDNLNSQHFYFKLCEVLQSPATSLAISYQDCSSADVLYLLASGEESTGFGAALTDRHLGLFAVPFSLLMHKGNLKAELDLLKKENATLLKEKARKVAEREQCVREFNALQESLALLVSAREQASQALNPQEYAMWVKQNVETLTNAHVTDMKKLDTKVQLLRAKISSEKQTAEHQMAALEQKHAEEMERKQNEINNLSRITTETKKKLQTLEFYQSRKFEGFEGSLEQLSRQAEHFKEKELCRVCMTEKSNCVFVPCGHVVVCTQCLKVNNIEVNKAMRKKSPYSTCLICRTEVKKVLLCHAY